MERNEQYQELINEWTAAGQGHIFKFWNELDEKQKDDLYRQAKVRTHALAYWAARSGFSSACCADWIADSQAGFTGSICHY